MQALKELWGDRKMLKTLGKLEALLSENTTKVRKSLLEVEAKAAWVKLIASEQNEGKTDLLSATWSEKWVPLFEERGGEKAIGWVSVKPRYGYDEGNDDRCLNESFRDEVGERLFSDFAADGIMTYEKFFNNFVWEWLQDDACESWKHSLLVMQYIKKKLE